MFSAAGCLASAICVSVYSIACICQAFSLPRHVRTNVHVINQEGPCRFVVTVVLCCLVSCRVSLRGQSAPNASTYSAIFSPCSIIRATRRRSWPDRRSSGTRNTFILQQANIFFRKQFNSRFAAFVDLEFTNTYASTRKWGTFRLEEAWVRYQTSEEFSIKAGLLVPVFNNLNEIKNRMPLLPYITRPFVYEAAAKV